VETGPQRIVIVECEPAGRRALEELLATAGYAVRGTSSTAEAVTFAREQGADAFILNAELAGAGCREALAELRNSVAARGMRVIAVTGANPAERALGLDLGADDVLSRPWAPEEMLARIRAQLRTKREEDELRGQGRTAREEERIEQAATEALASTEKMTLNLARLGRALRIGLAVLLAAIVAIAAAVIYDARRSRNQMQQTYALAAQIDKRLAGRGDLLGETRKFRESGAAFPLPSEKRSLESRAVHLRSQIAQADPNQIAALERELAATNARLGQLEREVNAAQGIIREYVDSVCLLHVVVAFRDMNTGKMLRYTGVDSQGKPLQDSNGNPKLSPNGNGDEAHWDILGTAFLFRVDGEAVTNRHVAEPWWRDASAAWLISKGIQPEVAEITAYFPHEARSFPVTVVSVSHEADLALLHISLGNLKRSPLPIAQGRTAAVPGQSVISVGYATGIVAILARTSQQTADEIIGKSGGDPSKVLNEVAKRGLIYPLITQGHIGEVTPQKIVFDAQTTNGGSGGPLFNQDGRVIGVTYEVLTGFEGSNFGVPIAFLGQIVAQTAAQASSPTK
jgi:DNA-binding response OmpR family regulator/S1-C subfamily serine protease